MKTRLGVGVAQLLAPLTLVACVGVPTGPSVLVLPGTSRSFSEFQRDDDDCRQFASSRSGQPTDAGNAAAVAHAAVATAVGAAAGAAIGAAAGDAAEGAAVGAGSGLLVGAAGGLYRGDYLASDVQRRYDNAYLQCMYAQGHQVPSPGSLASGQGDPRPRDPYARRGRRPPPPPNSWAPPPPPYGPPPPPPPDAS